MLLAHRGFALAAILSLGIGIGANTAIFTIVNAVLLRALPYEDPERIVLASTTRVKSTNDNMPISAPDFLDIRDRNEVFEQIAGFSGGGFNVTGLSEPLRVQGFRSSPSIFGLLGIKPAYGRLFSTDEENPGAGKVVILSNAFWRNHCGADPGTLGRTLLLDDDSYTVIGILPEDFQFPMLRADVWVPLVLDRRPMNRGNRFLKVIGRLRAGVTLPQAEGQLETVVRKLAEDYPATNSGLGIRLMRLQDHLVRQSRMALLVLMGIVAFVLLITCANVANLLLARASLRQKEMAVRVALGAGRPQLMRQLLTECMILSGLGGLLGILLARWGVALLSAAIPDYISDYVIQLKRLDIDGRVLVVTILISLATGFLFGSIPALQMSAGNLADALKDSNLSSRPRRRDLRSILVIAEIAAACVLLVGAGLMMRTMVNLIGTEPGFNSQDALTMQLSLSLPKYRDAHRASSFFKQVVERAAELPGVQSAGLISELPLADNSPYSPFSIESGEAGPDKNRFGAQLHSVSPAGLQTLEISLIEGRYFDDRDTDAAPLVAIVNRGLAQTIWPGQSALGRRIKLSTPEAQAPWLEIVGVVSGARRVAEASAEELTIYLPHQQSPNRTMSLVIRTSGDPDRLIANVREEVRSLDATQPVYNIQSLARFLSDRFAPHRLLVILFGAFAAIAVALAIVGIYGVMAYLVNQRRHEIGVRVALGARPSDVLTMILKYGFRLAFAGVAIGLAGAAALTRTMASLLVGVTPTDLPTLLTGAAAMLIVAGVASYVPSRRAMRVDPIDALREQ